MVEFPELLLRTDVILLMDRKSGFLLSIHHFLLPQCTIHAWMKCLAMSLAFLTLISGRNFLGGVRLQRGALVLSSMGVGVRIKVPHYLALLLHLEFRHRLILIKLEKILTFTF